MGPSKEPEKKPSALGQSGSEVVNSKEISVCSKIEKLISGIKQIPASVSEVVTEKIYSPTSDVKLEGIETSIAPSEVKLASLTKEEIPDGAKTEKVGSFKSSACPITTVTAATPSQEIDIEGTTLTPQFWEKLVDAKKTQNKKVNIFLNKTIK